MSDMNCKNGAQEVCDEAVIAAIYAFGKEANYVSIIDERNMRCMRAAIKAFIEKDRLMTMTQRYTSVLRRHAGEWGKLAKPIQAECALQAARHIENLQDKVDAIISPWQPMRAAPKDGLAVLVLMEGSDIPQAVRWLHGPDDPHATEKTAGPGWHLTWDGTPVLEHDGPRYWMHCPDDPDA